MMRTQLYLPEELILELKFLAQELNTSVSETVRKTIAKGIPILKKRQAGKLDDIVGMIKTDKAPKDLSENLDKYLYK